MLDRIISYSFYTLFLLTPLFWSSLNYELFEYNKMILTYTLTVIIVGTWVFKMISEKSLIFKRTPLDIFLLLFLGSQVLSTIFSMDHHTSIWGYYSRSNGGLLSIISYLLLYWAFVSNMGWDQVRKILKFGLISGFIVSLYGIMEHFGVSPSCIILRGEFNASCWIQVVQDRVFATLGQPNWMAEYLAMLIFPALYFLLQASTLKEKINYYILILTMYLAFTFTYSRGPTLGLIAGIVVFLLSYGYCHLEGKARKISALISDSYIREKFFASLKTISLAAVLGSFLIINLLFGSALTSFRLIAKFSPPPRPGISLPTTSGTQLENGGTESGQIRLVVWQGALDIFKHYPIFGSGLETFAYSYYQYRPASHNLTSEWDFLYNKAHNEYLNYLATTGIIGFGTYMLMIGAFVFWCIKYCALNIKGKASKNLNTDYLLFVPTLLASYISYLISNFFLFSVVIIAVFFYLFPALVFVATNSTKSVTKLPFSFLQIIYRRPLYTKITKGLVIFFSLYLLFAIFQHWYADTLFAKGERASDAGNPGRAYNLLTSASDLNKGEPLYRSELAFSAAEAAASLESIDATLSAVLKDEAFLQMEQVLTQSPKNVSYFRTAIRTYFELSTIDPSYTDKTLQALDLAINLAPTDPKLYYNKALILDSLNKKDEEIQALHKALELKPNYLEVLDQLKEATKSSTSVGQ